MLGRRSITQKAGVLVLAALVYAGTAARASDIERRFEASPPGFSEFDRGAADRPSGRMFPSPLPDQSARLLREPPSITGEIHVGAHTVIPYVGAGFGGGYATERDRIFNQDPTLQQKHVLGNTSGSGYLPNEFQVGLRIPF